jgi:hypothetical protein
VVEQRADVLDVGERPAGKRRLAEAAEVRSNDAMALGEGVNLVVPEPAIADAGVKEDDRGPGSDLVVGDLGAVEGDRAQLSATCSR